MSVIVTESLSRRYGSRRGIEGVSLRVPEGSLYGFLGPNGAGKTTTIRVLLGFLRPSAGSASVFGMDCWRRSKQIKSEVGYVPGDLRLPTWMNGWSALSVYGRIRGRDMVGKGERREGCGADLADMFELDLSVKVRNMSRGMRQKLGLVLAMAHRPRLLVLDEPSSALDPLMQDRLRAQLRRLASQGTTVFFSSHTLGEVEQLCDRVAIVRAGRIVADSTLQELRRMEGHEVVITWKGPNKPIAATLPAGLVLDEHMPVPTVWKGRVSGPVEPLMKFLGERAGNIADISITRPDLETLFRRFYAPGEDRGTNHGDTEDTEKNNAG